MGEPEKSREPYLGDTLPRREAPDQGQRLRSASSNLADRSVEPGHSAYLAITLPSYIPYLPVFRQQIHHKTAIGGYFALRKVHFVAQVGFNSAEMSVLELALCHAGLCFHTYPRIDLHLNILLLFTERRDPC